jgi:hypothetical protein
VCLWLSLAWCRDQLVTRAVAKQSGHLFLPFRRLCHSLSLVRLLLRRRVFICLLCGALSLVYRLAHCGLGCTLKTPGSSGFVPSLSPKQIKQDGVSRHKRTFSVFCGRCARANCIRHTVCELHALVAQQMVHCVSLGVCVKRGKYVG